MLLRDHGALDLDQPVSELLPIPAFRVFTIRHLLTHTSGLPAVKPWYQDAASLNEMIQRMARLELNWAPGTRHHYSDLGFMLLGKIVEVAARDSLDAFCHKHIFGPLGMAHTGFTPPDEWRSSCAATEQCRWRNRLIVGEVHDENASAVGGVSGHAGLFAPAGDLAKFCSGFLEGRILSKTTIEEMTHIGQVPHYPWQGLGWKMDPWMNSAVGFLPARAAMGHAGWTGTALWMDRDTGLFSILLSNTCHPSREKRYNKTLRRVFHIHVAAAHYPSTSNAHTGLDRVVLNYYEPLRGKRIALLTNHAARDQLGRHILDVLALQPEVMLKRLYSPEHGIRGQAEAGKDVPPETGPIPVLSLYGKRKQPTQEELVGIELFVVDLPDVGSRYYTYVATMKECMKACAKAGVPVLVLDRPNPVGGAVLEGPIARRTGSPVCAAAIPIRHGMTLGELALFLRKTAFANTKLNVFVNVADNWPRERLFSSCALPWMPPSPNIPTPETALVYVGTCLFEGTNLNEGRGTDTPFFLLGAPWLEPEKVLRDLRAEEHPGCVLEPMRYTPRSLPGKASHPRYQDQICQGIHIQIRDPYEVRAFTLAVALLRAIRRRHPKDFAWDPFFDTLAGGPWLRGRIEAGARALAIIEEITPSLKAFDTARPKRYQSTAEMLKG